MRYRLLGPLQVVEDDGTVVAVAAPKRRVLLAVLLLHASEPVSVANLTDALWGDHPPQTAVSSLCSHVSRLRREIHARIAYEASGYRLVLADARLDVPEFLDRLAAGRRALQAGDVARASEVLGAALALWHGPPLADFAQEPWAQPHRRRLEELRLEALGDRIEADLLLGLADHLVGDLEALVAEHPLHERAWGQLMRALYLSGRQAEALAAYRRLRSTLVEELGIDPSPELQRLEARVLQQDPALGTPSALLG